MFFIQMVYLLELQAYSLMQIGIDNRHHTILTNSKKRPHVQLQALTLHTEELGRIVYD